VPEWVARRTPMEAWRRIRIDAIVRIPDGLPIAAISHFRLPTAIATVSAMMDG
jgi:hypothetical protein